MLRIEREKKKLVRRRVLLGGLLLLVLGAGGIVAYDRFVLQVGSQGVE